MEQEEKLCEGVKTVREFTYLGDRVSDGRGCEAAVSARTRCGWAKHRECSQLLYGRIFPLKLKRAVYRRPTIVYRSEAWFLKERWKYYKGLRDPW